MSNGPTRCRAAPVRERSIRDQGGLRAALILWEVQRNWGLHLVDFNVALGNLIEIVAQQSRAYLKR